MTINVDSDLFADAYKDQKVNYTDATATVKASVTGTKLVAPGTNGKLLESSITGTPEVSVQVTSSVELELEGWKIPTDVAGTTEDYCPIVITIDNVDYKMGSTADRDNHVYDTIGAFKTAVQDALTTNITVNPNTDLGTNYGHTVTWKWEFVSADAGSYQTDAKDTALGNLNPAPTIGFTYTATVTQVN